MIEQERVRKLLHSIEKLESYQEIQNEMGRMIAAFNFRQAQQVLSHFALEKEKVSLEVADEGVFEGREAVETIVREKTDENRRIGTADRRGISSTGDEGCKASVCMGNKKPAG